MGFEASARAMSENYSVQEVIGLQRNCVATCLRRRCDAVYRDMSLSAHDIEQSPGMNKSQDPTRRATNKCYVGLERLTIR